MSIVIAGASDLGLYLASVLSEEQENVILIDPDQKRLESLARSLDIATLVANETDWSVLDSLLEQKPKLFVALAPHDSTNLLACSIAKNLGYPITVAAITNPKFLDHTRLDIDRLFFVDHIIAPEVIVAHDLFKVISNPGSVAIETFAHGAVQMRTVVMPETWETRQLKHIDFGDDLLVGVIRRKRRFESHEETQVIIPFGSDELIAGDEVTFVGETSTILEMPKRFGLPTKKVENAIIAGANKITSHLVTILKNHNIHVKVIEESEEACQALAQDHSEVTVMQQDPSNLSFLLSERVDRCDVFLSATPSTEFNILTASLAQEAGASSVYALVSDMRHAHLLKRLGIDYALSEKEGIVSRILSFIHAESAVSTRTLYENQIVIMELKVSATTKIAGIPIFDLTHLLPKGCLIALIENRGQIMIAKGERIVAPGDTVIVIITPDLVGAIKEIF